MPGVGEKTAKKLIAKYGSVEQLLEHTDELKGKQKENVENNAEQARLSKQLATIILDVPVEISLDDLELGVRNDEALQSLLVQFEFAGIGKRLYGKEFQTGRGNVKVLGKGDGVEDVLIADLKTIDDVEASYEMVDTAESRAKLVAELKKQKAFCFDTETSGLDPKRAQLAGLAFSWKAKQGFYVPITNVKVIDEFRDVLGDSAIEKVGHNLKFDLLVMLWHGVEVRGPMFDTMLAHALVSPDQRHTMDYISEALLGYSPVSITSLIGDKDQEGGQMSMLEVMERKPEDVANYAAEDADVTWQLAEKLRPMLEEAEQHRVYYDVEAPLIPVLAALEFEGIRIDVDALGEISEQLGAQMKVLEQNIYEAAGGPFNLNSPKQLGEILVERLKLIEKPKKTRTGQYKMDEQVLSGLAMQHEIAADILGYREATKLKSTYVDALPHSVLAKSGRVHTQFEQLMTATGRLASNNPNLQNIPVRTEQGREIRKAFVPREGFKLLSADYSQIELRVMASLSGDSAMTEAFEQGLDIHTATAARVYGVAQHEVLREQRSAAKMVNFGIIYGITGFGLAQRLGIPRSEANEIIEEYFRQYPGVKQFMDSTIEFAQERGYVETMTGRRRALRDINSRNWNLRGTAERTAINTPVQGSAADMIKLAMIRVHQQLLARDLRTRMLLQVHDELVFDLCEDEADVVVPLVVDGMKAALPLKVPIVVDYGIGDNWLQAH